MMLRAHGWAAQTTSARTPRGRVQIQRPFGACPTGLSVHDAIAYNKSSPTSPATATQQRSTDDPRPAETNTPPERIAPASKTRKFTDPNTHIMTI